MSDNKTHPRYAVFRGDNYYPAGGWCDFLTWADSVAEGERTAVVAQRKEYGDGWFQVVDTNGWKIVSSGQIEGNHGK